MEELLDLNGPWAQWVQQWGYWAVFFGIMLENAGIPVPGETIIVLGSIMAGKGILRIEVLYPVVVLGAILGDNIGYLVGLRGGRPLLFKLGRIWRIPEAKILETEARFRRHADWGVFFGRFIMLLRIFAGPIAGIIHMPWPRFFLFNALGAVVWAAVVVGLSYLLGTYVTTLLHNLGFGMLGVFALVVAFFVFQHFRHRPSSNARAGADPRGEGLAPLSSATETASETPGEGAAEPRATEPPDSWPAP